MNILKPIFLLIVLVFSACESFLYPMENIDLETECTLSNQVLPSRPIHERKGIHLLVQNCTALSETVGYILYRGPVVCCQVIAEGKIRKSFVGIGDKLKNLCEISGSHPPEVGFQIFGGRDSTVGEFPHMAALGYSHKLTNEINFKCGGSIISDKFVLTAAHCVIKVQPTIIRLGRTSLDLSDTNDWSPQYDSKIKRIIIEPGYDIGYSYNDIALIELKSSISFGEFISPICVDTGFNDGGIDDEEEKRQFTIIGFGSTDGVNKTGSTWLKKARVRETPSKKCAEKYNSYIRFYYPYKILRSQICSLGENSSNIADTCNGDSGSSMQITSKSNRKYYLVGVTSFGRECASDFPGVYTRVSSFIEWIESILWPQTT